MRSCRWVRHLPQHGPDTCLVRSDPLGPVTSTVTSSLAPVSAPPCDWTVCLCLASEAGARVCSACLAKSQSGPDFKVGDVGLGLGGDVYIPRQTGQVPHVLQCMDSEWTPHLDCSAAARRMGLAENTPGLQGKTRRSSVTP